MNFLWLVHGIMNQSDFTLTGILCRNSRKYWILCKRIFWWI